MSNEDGCYKVHKLQTKPLCMKHLIYIYTPNYKTSYIYTLQTMLLGLLKNVDKRMFNPPKIVRFEGYDVVVNILGKS